jgi:nucleoside-diphosphate-sugar epimerase
MPDRRPTLLITGATGFIGSHLASHFAARDWNVIALVRHIPQKPATNILYSFHDLLSNHPAEIPDDIDVFIHAGYIPQEKENDALKENTQAASLLLRSLEDKNVKQKIFLSSLSADENALSVYGKQKAAIEKLFLKQNGTVIRAGLVLGDGGLFASMRDYLQRKRLVPLFGKGDQPVQFVHVDDLGVAIEAVVVKNLTGKFVVASDAPMPYREFYTQLCKTIGVAPRFVRVPFWLAGMMIGTAGALGMKLPVTKDNLLGLKQMKHIASADDLRKLGVTLRSLQESLSAKA